MSQLNGVLRWRGQIPTINGLEYNFSGEVLAKAKTELGDGSECVFLLDANDQIVDYRPTGNGIVEPLPENDEPLSPI